jgi:hypothetical protein
MLGLESQESQKKKRDSVEDIGASVTGGIHGENLKNLDVIVGALLNLKKFSTSAARKRTSKVC